MPDPEELYRTHQYVARALARRQYVRARAVGLGMEDLLQEARWGLWRAACAYDDTRGSFANYAWYRVYGAIEDGFRDWVGNRVTRQKLRHPVLRASGYGVDAIEQPAAWSDEAVDVRLALRELDTRTAFVLRCRSEGMTLKRIGELLGVTESRASQLLRDALPRLARFLRSYAITEQ